MLSGLDTLRSIDGTLAEVRRQGLELDQTVQQASHALLTLRQSEVDCYRRLAALRLEDLVQGDVQQGLDHTEHQVSALIEEREQELRDLKDAIDQAEQRQLALEAQRASDERDLQQTQDVLDRAEEATQQRLREDAEHQLVLSRAQAADATATEAESKAERAEQDRGEKGKPYESEPLFMYLWQRGYGTSRYSALPLIRYLDSWVARLCRYQDARPNYAMLLEIPLRLGEHAQQVRRDADEVFEQLRKLEEDAACEDGVIAHQQAMARARQTLDETDLEIQEPERQAASQMEQRATYAGGEDECSKRALSLLAAMFQQQSLEELRRTVEATANAQDDEILHELRGLAFEEQRLEESLAHHKSMHNRHLQRQRELEQVRQKFKDRRYDDAHSTFSNGDLVSTMLREFLRGAAGSADVWGTLRRNQRQHPGRSDPDFGSGGFGRGGGVWRSPSSPRSAGGSSSSGGFRTGGGF